MTTEDHKERFLSVAEAARYLNYSYGYVLQWCQEGYIQAYKPSGRGGSWRIPLSEVIRVGQGKARETNTAIQEAIKKEQPEEKVIEIPERVLGRIFDKPREAPVEPTTPQQREDREEQAEQDNPVVPDKKSGLGWSTKLFG